MAMKKKAPDWAAVQADYLANTGSVREIGRRYGVSEAAIRKRANAEGWTRDGTKGAQCAPAPRAPKSAPRDPNAKPPEVAAIADRGRGLVLRLLDELDTVTTHVGDIEDMICETTANDTSARRRDAMLNAISLGNRAMTMKSIATALKTLNETSAPQGKKAQQQEKADAMSSRFQPMGPPKLTAVK